MNHVSGIEAVYPLSPLQQGFLFHARLDEIADPYVVQQCFRIEGALDAAALRDAWRLLVKRHAVLRTVFAWKTQREPLQVVKRDAPIAIDTLDWSAFPDEAFDNKLDDWLTADRQRGFDLAKAPLMRVTVINKSSNLYYLVKTYHHIITDGASSVILMRELAEAYRTQMHTRQLSLPEVVPYRDYIRWLQKQDRRAARAFWKDALEGFTITTQWSLPVPENATDKNKSQQQFTHQLDISRTQALRAFAARHQLTLNTLVQGAWSVLLSQYCNTRRVLYGVTVAGRPPRLSGSEHMVGLFINTLPMSVKLDAQVGVVDWLKRLQARLQEMQRFAYIPLSDIQAQSALPGRKQLFESLVVFENYVKQSAASGSETENELNIERVSLNDGTHYPLTLYAIPGECLRFRLWYQPARFEAASVPRLVNHFTQLLMNLASAPGALPVGCLTGLTEKDEKQLQVWNATNSDFDFGAGIIARFEQQVALKPDAIALVFKEKITSYAELNVRANRLAHALRSRGLAPEDRVGLFINRGPELVTAILAILKAGAAYVPLDPAYPEARREFMRRDTAVTLVLTEQSLSDNQPMDDVETILIDSEAHLSYSGANPDTVASPGRLAYMIYTSGSTGKPKAVQVTQRNLLNFLLAMQERLGFKTGQGWLAVTSLSFDISALELLLPLLYGGRVVIADESEVTDGAQLMALLTGQSIDWMQATPATWKLLIDSGWRGEAQLNVLCGGEALPAPLAKRLLDVCRRVFNVYGPTETTVWSTVSELKPLAVGARSVSIGAAVANTKLHVLDATLQALPVGAVGELYIGGDGVTRGYHRRPALTAEYFVPDIFSDQPGARLYKTGDWVRRLPDGALECLGRVDRQIKLRGYRIEPGEIEAALQRHPLVRDASVVLRTRDAREPRLLAYWTAAADGKKGIIDEAELRRFLREQLTAAMMPAQFIRLARMPLTPTGKLDRKQLPEPSVGGARDGTTLTQASGNVVAQLLMTLWHDLLGAPVVRADADFFELGGHSLLAAQLVARVRLAFGVDLPVRLVFDKPILADLAHAIEALLASGRNSLSINIRPAPPQVDYPLSFEQERLWFLYRMDRGSHDYHLPIVLAIDGDLDTCILAESFERLCAMHPILRTRIRQMTGQARQRIETGPPLETVDLSGLAGDQRQAALDERLEREKHRAFELETEAPLRAICLRLSIRSHVLCLVAHHIAADGLSLKLMARTLGRTYRVLHDQGQAEETDLPVLSYIDYANWQREPENQSTLESELDYWKTQLDGAPSVLELPTGRPRQNLQTASGKRVKFSFSRELSQALNRNCRRQNVTLFMGLLAVFNVLLSRCCGQDDICIGAPVANRYHPAFDSIIGTFVNTLVIRNDLSGNPAFSDVLKQVRGTVLAAFAHQQLPFERLVDALQPVRSTLHTPLFQVAMEMQSATRERIDQTGLAFRVLEADHATAKFDLTLHIVEARESINGSFEYNDRLFDRKTVERLLLSYQHLLESAMGDTSRRLSQLTLMSDADRAAMFDKHQTVTYPAEASLIETFERRVAANPAAIAIRFCGASLSYGDLNERSNRMAHALLAAGVRGEVFVGLHCRPSMDLIVGILGILKAGGCYVPLDPELPEARIETMIQDAGVSVVVTDDGSLRTSAHDANSGCAWIDVGGNKSAFSDRNPSIRIDPSQLAYVIYTSGSTGAPKGVGINHAQVQRLFSACEAHFKFTSGDVWSLFHAYGFDFSVWELWGALRYGGRLVIAPSETRRSPQVFAELLKRERVTVLSQTPTAFHGLSSVLMDTSDKLTSLRYVVFGGEALDVGRLSTWFEVYGDEQPQLINMYGITETTVHATHQRVRKSHSTDSSERRGSLIGGPLNDLRAYVLDRYQQLLPEGIAGELYIGGSGIGRGYINRRGLTAERFAPDPYSKQPGARLYRTGDKAVLNSDGSLSYLGRLDSQIQLRGFRVELGEIEAQLRTLASVTDAAVMLREDVGAEPMLVAYVTGIAEEADMRAQLERTLPHYMQPGRYVAVETIPMTANGKLDRKALPKPDAAQCTDNYVTPRNKTEQILADIWCEVLGLDRVGVYDNFFSLGGHSLSAVQLVDIIRRRLGSELSLGAFFEQATIAAAAGLLSAQADLVNSPLVRLRPGSEEQCLYCIHPGGGHVLGYTALAEGLENACSVYGIQARSLLKADEYMPSLADMAQDYAKLILAHQPKGPVALVGWSMGGLLALAIAKYLEYRRRRVIFLGLVEPSLATHDCSQANKKNGRETVDIVQKYAGMLGAGRGDKFMQSISPNEYGELEDSLSNLSTDDARLQRMLDFAHARQLVSPNYNLQVANWRRAVLAHADSLVKSHKIEPVESDIHIWLSANSKKSNFIKMNRQRFTKNKLFVEVIEASHNDIIRSPDLRASIDGCISSVFRTHGLVE